MSDTRSPSESAFLKAEAERRVRAGDKQVDVAHDLGLPPSTLRHWATGGRWRRKDIAFELDAERGRAALARIVEATSRQEEEALNRAARTKELGEAALAAMNAANPNDENLPPDMKPVPTHQLSLALAHNLLQQGRLGEAEQAARFAMRFAQAQKATNDRDSARWRDDRARIMKWWDEHRTGFHDFHKYAMEIAEELEGRETYERDMRELECCPTCTRPMEFWPAAMDERIAEVDEALDKRAQDRD
jgi:hypothetical protein